MTRSTRPVRRLAFGLCGPAAVAWASIAAGQTAAPSPPVSVVVPATAASWSAANLPGTQQYQDKYIGGGTMAPDISSGDAAAGADDTSGLARSLQIDAVASVLSSHGGGTDGNATESGIVAKSQWETAGYGAWSLDASARASGSDPGSADQGQGGVFTLRQRGMPFDGGWQADNGLGDLNSPDISLARLQPRFYLPTAPMQGLTTEWHGPSDVQIVAGGGVPGLYDGIEVPNFRTLDGSTATAGAQWSPASHWTVGGQFIEAHDVNLSVGQFVDGASLISSDTGLLSAAWADHGSAGAVQRARRRRGRQGQLAGRLGRCLHRRGRIQQSARLFASTPISPGAIS